MIPVVIRILAQIMLPDILYLYSEQTKVFVHHKTHVY